MTTEVDVPTEIGYGKVVGRFVKFTADTLDPGNTPNEVPLAGSVLLAPMTQIMRWATVTPPRLAVASAADCPIVNGDLCAPGTTVPGVHLVATDQPWAQPMIIQWRATFHLTGVTTQPASVVFDVPTGGEVDLALVVSIPPEPPAILMVSVESAASAQASADEAAAQVLLAAEQVELAAEQVELAADQVQLAAAQVVLADAEADEAEAAKLAAQDSATAAAGSATAAAGSASAAAANAAMLAQGKAVLVLSATAPVPGGTPAGTVILRTAT